MQPSFLLHLTSGFCDVVLCGAVDSSINKDVNKSDRIIKIIAPYRSIEDARLKNAHHTIMANPNSTPDSIPNMPSSGRIKGVAYLPSKSNNAKIMPGSRRIDFCCAGSMEFDLLFIFSV